LAQSSQVAAQLSARLRCAECGGPLHSVKPWRLEDVLRKSLGPGLECVFELENVGRQIDDDGARNDDNHGPQKRRKKSRTGFVEPRFIAPVLGHGQSSNSVSGRTAVLRCDLHESPPPIVSYARHPEDAREDSEVHRWSRQPLYRGGIRPLQRLPRTFRSPLRGSHRFVLAAAL
jgi:hypothetical protein